MTTAPSGRRRPARLAAGTALLAVAGMIIGLSACDPEPMDPSPPTTSPSATSTGSATSSPTSTRTPSPSPTPTSEQDKAEEAIRQAIAAFYAATNKVRKDPQVDAAVLEQVADGELLEIARRTVKEWRAKGWRQVGNDLKVESLTVDGITTDGDLRTAKVFYCVDSEGVGAVDRDGKSLVPSDRPDEFPRVAWLESSDGVTWIPVREYDGGTACDGE